MNGVVLVVSIMGGYEMGTVLIFFYSCEPCFATVIIVLIVQIVGHTIGFTSTLKRHWDNIVGCMLFTNRQYWTWEVHVVDYRSPIGLRIVCNILLFLNMWLSLHEVRACLVNMVFTTKTYLDETSLGVSNVDISFKSCSFSTKSCPSCRASHAPSKVDVP